jgi:hypothetical protein
MLHQSGAERAFETLNRDDFGRSMVVLPPPSAAKAATTKKAV